MLKHLFPFTIFCIGAWFLDYYKTLLKKKQNIKARKYCYFEYLLYLLSEKNHFGSRFTKSKKPNVNVNVQNPVEKKPTSFAFT